MKQPPRSQTPPPSPAEPDPAPAAGARRRRRTPDQLAATEAPLCRVSVELPPPPVAPPEIAEAIGVEAEDLELLEMWLCDLQRYPLGPEAALEVARLRGLLLNFQAAAAALQTMNLRR